MARISSSVLEVYSKYNPKTQQIEEVSYGTLNGIKKLLAIKENRKFYASEFGISGGEMNGLSFLSFIRPTGVKKPITFTVKGYDYEKRCAVEIEKTAEVFEWELTNYQALHALYHAIMAVRAIH